MIGGALAILLVLVATCLADDPDRAAPFVALAVVCALFGERY